ncbi:MAG TPA: DUF6770 family protein [Saprospiraceae bacterium]|nr:DUF6770 family protein [Saprospiraceae bacterium]
MRILLLTLLMFVLCLNNAFAQKISFPSDVNIRPADITPIVHGGDVVGYYAYQYKDAHDGKNHYDLFLMNSNFEITQKLDFGTPNGWPLEGLVFRVYNLASGKELNLISLIHKDGHLIPVNIIPRKDGFSIYGKYFEITNTEEGFSNENLKGIFMQRYNNAGQMVSEVLHPVAKIAALKDQGGKEIISEGRGIWIQNMLEVAEGKSYLIGENYNLGSKETKGYKDQLYIGDFYVIEFDKDFNPSIVHQISKEQSKHPSIGLRSSTDYEIGKLAERWYDYKYSSMNSARTIFTTVYSTYDYANRKSVDKYTIGAIAHNLDGELVNPKITLDNFPKNIGFIPAKTGYVAVFEYDEDVKDLSLTLYRFDF